MDRRIPVVEVQGLSRRYGRNVALDGVDFGVREGRVYGLVGANGAGKTTLIKHLLGLLRPQQGMRAQTALIGALAHRPQLLILDEPSNGLDVVVRRDIIDAIIRTVAGEGRSVVFSSHLLHEMERTCDHVTLIQDGRVTFNGDLDEIRDGHRHTVLRFAEPRSSLPPLEGLLMCSGAGRSWTAIHNTSLEDFARQISACGGSIDSSREATLEEIFVARSGGETQGTPVLPETRHSNKTIRSWPALADRISRLCSLPCPTRAPWAAECWLELRRYALPTLLLALRMALFVPLLYLVGRILARPGWLELAAILPLLLYFAGNGIALLNRHMWAFSGVVLLLTLWLLYRIRRLSIVGTKGLLVLLPLTTAALTLWCYDRLRHGR